MKSKVCANVLCQTSSTPLWRKGWIGSDGKAVRLCNACGIHFKKHHYCPLCFQIYKGTDICDASDPWIGCLKCSRYVHERCYSLYNPTKMDEPYICKECQHPSEDLKKRKREEEKKFQQYCKQAALTIQPIVPSFSTLTLPSSSKRRSAKKVDPDYVSDSSDDSMDSERSLDTSIDRLGVQEFWNTFGKRKKMKTMKCKMNLLCVVAEYEMLMLK